MLRGNFNLGTLGNVANLDVYKIIGNLLGFTDTKYKTNLVYNVAQNLIFQYTNWYTEEEINNFKNGTATWVYDDQLINKLTTSFLIRLVYLLHIIKNTQMLIRKQQFRIHRLHVI